MVHALKEAWRVSRSTVLDIRPLVNAPQIWVKDRAGREANCGALVRRATAPENHAGATEALAQALSAGWFTRVAAQQFDWVDAFEDADSLVDEVTEEWDNWLIDEDTALTLVRALDRAGRGARPFIRQGIGAQVLKKAGAKLV